MIIGGYRVGPLLRKTGKEILEDGILGLSAQTAYYFFFSVFPLLLFAAPLLGLFGDEHAIINWVMGQVSSTVPDEALALVRNVISDVVFSENAPGLMSVGAVLAAWTGSNVFGSLIDALNHAYDVPENRPWWKKRLIALGAVIAAGMLMAVSATVMLAGPEITKWLTANIGLGRTFEITWMILQYPVAFTLLIGMMYLIYYFLPNLRQHKRQILVGAIAASVLWVIVTLGFRFYVTNFGSYNKTYGTIGGVIVLLTWMYLTMLVILVGGELNAELHHGTGAIDPRRGAVYAGRVVSASDPSRTSNERAERVEPLAASGPE